MQEYEESNLCKSFPSRFMHGPFKVLTWKWFNSRSCVCCVLVFDLIEKRIRAFIGSPHELFLGREQEEEAVKDVLDNGASIPTDVVITIFKRYFYLEEVIKNLDKDFKMFLELTKLLDEK